MVPPPYTRDALCFSLDHVNKAEEFEKVYNLSKRLRSQSPGTMCTKKYSLRAQSMGRLKVRFIAIKLQEDLLFYSCLFLYV